LSVTITSVSIADIVSIINGDKLLRTTTASVDDLVSQAGDCHAGLDVDRDQWHS